VPPVQAEVGALIGPTAGGLAKPGLLQGVIKPQVPAEPPPPQPLKTNLAPQSAPIQAVASPPDTPAARKVWRFGLLLWLLLALLVTVGLLRHYSVLKSRGGGRG